MKNSAFRHSTLLLLGLAALLDSGSVLAAEGPHADKHWTYKVHRDETLGEISTRLYGTTKRWRRIAKWNQLEKPFAIHRGQKLILLEPPTLSKKEGDEKVL